MFRAGIPESGILRKHKVLKENLDDLLVFGYACKLFRDDEKAIYIDQGKHLIPWMGDETLRIDRYDGRGTLSDLKSSEASREGYDTTRWLGLNESERKVEQLCDEERYYSLTSNEEEELLYKEEELKRQRANEFQYKYEDSPKNDDDNNSQSSISTVEQDDRIYVPRPELDVPVDISIPKTIKENARIEKTAMFVSQQGLQMEILIKAKQANNLQFSFMNQADLLYKYYRHVVAAFKSGRYTMTEYGNSDVTTAPCSPVQQDSSISAPDQSADIYNHQSSVRLNSQQPPLPPPTPLDHIPNANASGGKQLADVTFAPTAVAIPPAPALRYRPRADCAYTQLISRIKGAQQLHKEQQGGDAGDKVSEDSPGRAVQGDGPNSGGEALTAEQQQQYFQYYYTARYYDGYKQLGEQYTAQGLDPQLLLQNTSIQEQMQAQAVQYAQSALTAYMAQYSNATPTVISTAQASPVGQNAQTVVQTTVAPAQTTPITDSTVTDAQKPVNPLLTLAHYGSDSDEENSGTDDKVDKENDGIDTLEGATNQSESVAYMIPPEDVSVIIDKMAAYVSKNGGDFENIVRSRGDSRFDFLTPEHDYHLYYKCKLKEYLTSSLQTDDNKHNGSSTTTTTTTENGSTEKKQPLPVSFSIKPRDDSQKEIKQQSALPVEESSGDEENDSEIANDSIQADVTVVPTAVHTDIDSSSNVKCVLKDVTVIADVSRSVNVTDQDGDDDVTDVKVLKKDDGDKKRGEKHLNADFEEDDPLLEMIDLTDDLDDKNDDESRIKHLQQHDQSKALQLERRRKAAAFLRLRSMMDVYKTIESQIEVKGNDVTTTTAAGKSRRSGDSSGEGSPKVGSVRARRVSTQSRSSDVVEIIDDSDDVPNERDEKTVKKERKKSKKKKSHKRKHSKSSRSRRIDRSPLSKRKSKKRRKRSPSISKSRSKMSRSRSRLRSSSRSS